MLKYLSTFVLVVIGGCGGGGGGDDTPLSAEAVCAQRANGFGNFFHCGSSQGNLQLNNFPDGSLGYCAPAREALGLVGYSVTTYAGGFFEVSSQSYASGLSRTLGNESPGYTRCTRQ